MNQLQSNHQLSPVHQTLLKRVLGQVQPQHSAIEINKSLKLVTQSNNGYIQTVKASTAKQRHNALLQILQQQQSQSGWIVLFAPEQLPSVAELQQLSIDPNKILLVHSRQIKSISRCIEQVAKEGNDRKPCSAWATRRCRRLYRASRRLYRAIRCRTRRRRCRSYLRRRRWSRFVCVAGQLAAVRRAPRR